MEDLKHKEHLDNLAGIRSLMEQSARFISLSGLTGVFAGIFALIGAFAAYIYLGYDFRESKFAYRILEYDLHTVRLNFVFFLIADAGSVLLAAMGVAIFLSGRKAKKKGLSIWNNAAKRMLLSLFIPLITGGIFSFALLFHGAIFLVAPATLIFYGLALLNAGKYTLRDIKYLGVSEIALGLVACYIYGYGLVFWAVGFGLFHILYGIIMWYKYDR